MYTGLELSNEVLKRANRPLTSEEIWNHAIEYGLDEECSVKGKTPERTIGARIYMDIKNNGEDSIFCIASKKPTRFYLTEKKDDIIGKPAPDSSSSIISELKYREADLHPLLVYYLRTNPHFYSHSKTINANAAKRLGKNQNEWRFPDIVSVYYPFDDYSNDEVYDLFENIKQTTIKISSFEIKKEINTSNVRMYYFQAISNSTWANEGYLVAAKIDEGAMEELRSLNRSFGIGVILFNLDNVSDSEILFPSRYSMNLDDDMVNRLSENSDFLSFINRINKNIKARDVNKIGYDPVLSEDAIAEKLSKINRCLPNEKS